MYTEGATRKTCLEQQVQAYNQLFHILFLILNDFCHDGHRSNLTAVEPATRVGTTRHRADRVQGRRRAVRVAQAAVLNRDPARP